MKSSINILGTSVNCLSYEKTINIVQLLIEGGGHKYVSVANVHLIMEAYNNKYYRKIINNSTLVTPDGMPLVWGLKLLGRNTERVYGPNLTLHVCESAANNKIPIGFYGSCQDVIDKLKSNLYRYYPELEINYCYSPPYRQLTENEDNEIVDAINSSGVKILFIGLGCPKQEKWMYEHRNKINAVMIGVGAAFDFIAGVKPQAPRWMQNIGMEWFYRLMTEPKRLWKRYLYHNPRFIFYFTLQLLGVKKFNNGD